MPKQFVGRSESERQELIDTMMECRPRLKIYALSLTRDRDRADDLVQDTLLKGIIYLDSFETGTNMAAWLFRIQRNEFISELRRTKPGSYVSLDDIEVLNGLAFRQFTSQSQHSHFHFNEVLLYLACLVAEQRDALIAAAYLFMPYNQAADIFGVSVGTIKSRVSRARDELCRLMETDYLETVDITPLKTATRGVPQSHPFYPIAKAYEELYADCDGVIEGKRTMKLSVVTISEEERLWQELVQSGALDKM